MFSKQLPFVSTLLLLLSIFPVVQGEYSTGLAELVGAGVVAFFLIVVIIIVAAIVISWNSWFPSVQRSKGKVKMPKNYWQKKQEAKMRLLDTSRGSRMTSSTFVGNGGANGHVNSRVRDTGDPTASWVQGWTITDRPESTGYEELAVAMDLDEEKDDYRIETTLEEEQNPPTAPNGLGRPFLATATVGGGNHNHHHHPEDPSKSTTTTQTGFGMSRQEEEDQASEFRIVAAVVDNEALDLGPYKTTDTQTGAREGGGGGGGGLGGDVSEQTMTVRMGEEEEGETSGSGPHFTSYSEFLESSRVAF